MKSEVKELFTRVHRVKKYHKPCDEIKYWLVVSTHLKSISQIGNLPQVGVKIKNV